MSIYQKFGILLTYIMMVTMNALANIVPINGITTGAVSDSYPNLFAPIGFTFGIWGVIYLQLLIMVLFFVGRSKMALEREMGREQVGRFVVLFVVSNVANSLWILAWHFRFIGVSVALMAVILLSLIGLMALVKDLKWPLGRLALVKPAIGVYFGWITVATVANITTLLVDLGFSGFGISESTWLMTILVVAALIAFFAIGWSSCPAYGLVILWAYYGILSKHLSPTGFDSRYPGVIVVLGLTMALVGVKTLWVGVKVLKGLKARPY